MKFALLGYGKMGKSIESIAVERGHEVVLKINADNLEDLTQENLSVADVAIEFSAPEHVLSNIGISLKIGTPIVVGTTGWYDQQEAVYKQVKEFNGTFLAASNFSVGVNIFFEINRRLAELMANQNIYTAAIEEIHHTEKLDSPSGTAITLADGIIQQMGSYSSWENNPSEKKEVLEIVSFREPNIPGTHEITYDSNIDQISIKHEAKNRKGFALGAVLAAEFIQAKKGIFTMKDVLKN
ncbi:4-hydroxy-tetrahydrodipicolinate reductase [Vicingaceae bacterium]|nr:4-hydroxy-tetrahydrodipicolinate reductase [Vicingaceae bacterium]